MLQLVLVPNMERFIKMKIIQLLVLFFKSNIKNSYSKIDGITDNVLKFVEQLEIIAKAIYEVFSSSFMIEIYIGVLTAGIIAAIVYIFRDKIKSIFLNNDLLAASQIPKFYIEFFDLYDEGERQRWQFTIQNKGETSIANFRIYSYKHPSEQLDYMKILPLKTSYGYKWSDMEYGEKIVFTCEEARDNFPSLGSLTEGLFIEMTDEHNIIFCLQLCVIVNEEGYISFSPQGLKRLKNKLPNKEIFERAQLLEKKYGVDIAI